MASNDHSLLTFPCSYPIKAAGHSDAHLQQTVLELMQRHVPNLTAAALSSRPSKTGRYTAITITFEASSRAQLDAIYRDLQACTLLVWVL
ncbi:MAG: DUF493 domain-containing protein [Gammaproteobacteria bacterium]|nr:DUF493 domain-containing protein [Gammaproteobacteria bacterium]